MLTNGGGDGIIAKRRWDTGLKAAKLKAYSQLKGAGGSVEGRFEGSKNPEKTRKKPLDRAVWRWYNHSLPAPKSESSAGWQNSKVNMRQHIYKARKWAIANTRKWSLELKLKSKYASAYLQSSRATASEILGTLKIKQREWRIHNWKVWIWITRSRIWVKRTKRKRV